MFKPSKLRAYLLRAKEAGLSPEAILEGSGTSWPEIEALHPFDLDVMADLFDYVAHRTPEGFAIRCGHASKVRDFGIVGFSMMSMPTLRAAFEHWNRYCLVAGHPLVTTVVEEGDQWQMHFEPRRLMTADAERFCIEASIAAMEPIIEELTGEPSNTLRIELPFARPADTESYAVFRTANIQFGRPHAAFHGRRSAIDRAIPAQDGDLREMLNQQCANFLAILTHERPLSERLEDLMRETAGEIPSLDDMAAKLGMSRRSLQRELRAQDISYQQIVKQFRMRNALFLLGERRANIKMIAYMLGFKDVGSFRRAFHEWTGQSVGEWQASQPAAPPGTREAAGLRAA